MEDRIHIIDKPILIENPYCFFILLNVQCRSEHNRIINALQSRGLQSQRSMKLSPYSKLFQYNNANTMSICYI